MQLSRRERALLQHVQQQGPVTRSSNHELLDQLAARGLLCSRKLIQHPRLANAAIAVYRLTWKGAAALVLAGKQG